MEHKVFRKTTKPLSYLKKKKHSKKSKRKRVIHEYEIIISKLLKKLKIADNADSENSDSKKYVLPDVVDEEGSIPNKLLKCNLKTYSSYTTSKSLNICKQSRNKCIRFISIDKYLQGKVSCTPNFNPYFKGRYSQINRRVNVCNDINRSVPMFTKVIEIPTVLNAHIHKEQYNGNFGCLQRSGIKSLNDYNETNFRYISGNLKGELEKQHFGLNEDTHIKHFGNNTIENFKDIFFQTSISPYTSVMNKNLLYTFKEVLKSSSATSKNQCMLPSTDEDYIHNEIRGAEVPAETSDTNFCNTSNTNSYLKSLNASSQISQTILDLFWLELKIKKCKTILKKFNYKSDSFKEFDSIKKKSSKMIMEYMTVLNKGNKSEVLFRGSSGLHISEQSTSVARSLNLVNARSFTAQPKKRKEICHTELTKNNTGKRMKRNCKRKRQDKDRDSHVIKRSKRLDECIMRASTVKTLHVKNTTVTPSEKSQVHNAGKKCQDILKKEIELASTSTSGTTVEAPMKVISTDCAVSKDPVDKEIKTIVSQLSPLQDSLDNPDTSCSRSIDPGSPLEIMHYDAGNGKRMVILPYIDADF